MSCRALFLVFFILPGVAFSQGRFIKFDRMTTKSGLPQEHVSSIAQDHNGFLWLGMEFGLARYDGYSFKTYRNDPNDSTSISSNIIRALFIDEQGYIWIGTDGGGVCRFDPRKEQFTSFKHEPDNPNSLSGNRVYSIAADRDGNIWAATLTKGLNRISFSPTGDGQCNVSNPCFTRFRYDPNVPNSLSDDNVWTILIDDRNRLWAGTASAGLNMLDLNGPIDENASFRRYQQDPGDPFSISSNAIKSLYKDSRGALWVGTEFKGLNRFDDAEGKFYYYEFRQRDPHSLSHNHVSCILEDKNGVFWLGTNGGGINIFDREKEIFYPFTETPGDPYCLNGQLVNTIFQSSSGVLWIGMANKGLNWIDPQKQQFQHYYSIAGKADGLSGNLVKAIYESRDGEIWVGTYSGGLNHFDPETEVFTHYLQDNAASNNVQRIFEDREGRFWVGTDGGGLFLFGRQTGTFSGFNRGASGTKLSGKAVWAIEQDLNGNLWIGTADGGLNRFDWETRQFRQFRFDPNDPHSINSNDVRALFLDHLGVLWVGTYGGGLNRYNPVEESFSHYRTIPGDSTSISNDIITDIFESSKDGQLWIGTFGGGLNRFDRLTGAFTAYREKHGLANDVVKSIEEDMEGNLWIGTLKGISKFGPETGTFVNYSISDGLQGYGFNLGASCQAKDSVLYFGGTNGFNRFFPDKINKLPNDKYPCLITDLKIFNRSIQPGEVIRKKVILEKAIHELSAITIPYFIDDFAFEFVAPNFEGAEKIKYAYQLEGANEQWQYTNANRRYAAYTSLPPGDYVFKVRATDKEGVWNGEVTELKVEILPAPWETFWAYLLYALLLGGAVFFIRRHKAGRIRLLNELKLERLERQKTRELNEMKLQFFTNISHEIRTPLTLILGPIRELIASGEGGREVRNQLHNINRNANRLLLLVNQLLEFREQEAGHTKMQVAKGDLVKFISETILSFKEAAKQRNIDFSFTHNRDAIMLWYDNDLMEKVFFNLLSNAFKFTPDGGKVAVHAILREESAEVVVEDNGRGIEQKDLPFIFDRFYKFNKDYPGNYLGSGIGLALVKGLVKLHHGDIRVESTPHEFTRFTISLPTGVKHFRDEDIVSGHKDSEDAAHYRIGRQEDFEEAAIAPAASADAPELLIIEDNDDIRNYLRKIFTPEYRIREALNGKQGWDLAMRYLPALIISDIMMPEMDGIALCKKLKTTLETSHIPIILLTARTSLVFQAEGLETGADDYITKPFNPRLLKLRAQNLIHSRKRLREKFGRPVSIEPHEVTITTPDQDLLQRAIQAVEKHMDDSSFDVNTLAREIGISRPVLYRKLPAITDQTPNEFIRIVRLKRAAQILDQADLAVSDVCYRTGFKTPEYFSKCFREFFGVLPSEYARQKK
ncbi:MAG: response regulator [Phaeodactylibacter sp.]|nr:response regulator [Phaeodactylibacter sp.]